MHSLILNKNLTFRQSKSKDLDKIFRLKKSGLKEYVKTIWGWNEENQIKIQEENFKPELTTIISHNRQDIGYLVKNESENELYIENLILQSEFQNLGLGTEVMQLIIKEAEFAKKTIRLKVLKINSQAKKFYKRIGFTKICETEFHFEMEKETYK